MRFAQPADECVRGYTTRCTPATTAFLSPSAFGTLIILAWRQIQISPILFGKNVPTDASPIPGGSAVGMRRGFASKVAQTSIVIVSHVDVEADDVTGLRRPEAGSREWIAKPTGVDGVDGAKRD